MTDQPVLAHLSLSDEVERFTPEDNKAGRRAEILLKEDDLRVTLITMRAGIELDEHSAAGTISIQVLAGRFEVTYTGGSVTIGPGEFLSLRRDVKHSVKSVKSGAFLLTLGWNASRSVAQGN